jgi:hypothetical protein
MWIIYPFQYWDLMNFEHILNKVLTESEAADKMKFAEKRCAGAKKIADAAKKKGGPAMLTYHHFIVKLPYYKDYEKGNLKLADMKKEYASLCEELHSYMDNIEDMDMAKFQRLVGKLEVLGELCIKQKKS